MMKPFLSEIKKYLKMLFSSSSSSEDVFNEGDSLRCSRLLSSIRNARLRLSERIRKEKEQQMRKLLRRMKKEGEIEEEEKDCERNVEGLSSLMEKLTFEELRKLEDLRRLDELRRRYPPPHVKVAKTKYELMNQFQRMCMDLEAKSICAIKDPYEVLGVKKGATPMKIKASYGTKIKSWIDTYGSFSANPEVLDKYQEAYMAVTDSEGFSRFLML